MIVILPGMVDTGPMSHTSDPQTVRDYNGWREDMNGGLTPETVAHTVSCACNMPHNACVA